MDLDILNFITPDTFQETHNYIIKANLNDQKIYAYTDPTGVVLYFQISYNTRMHSISEEQQRGAESDTRGVKYTTQITTEMYRVLSPLHIKILSKFIQAGHKITTTQALNPKEPWACEICKMDPYVESENIEKTIYMYKIGSDEYNGEPLTHTNIDGYPTCAYIKMQRALE